jgi:hypothetical protein
MKRHVLLVISKDPIDSGNIKNEAGVEHFVKKELRIGRRGELMLVQSAALEHCRESYDRIFRGSGKSVPLAIVSWMENLISSLSYKPLQEQRENKKIE